MSVVVERATGEGMNAKIVFAACAILLVSSIVFHYSQDSYKHEPLPAFTPNIKIEIQQRGGYIEWHVLNNTLDSVHLTVNGEKYLMRWGSGRGGGIYPKSTPDSTAARSTKINQFKKGLE